MKFSHRVDINDPLQVSLPALNRDQLWRGLVLRAENPMMFVPWLNNCRIIDRQHLSMSRELHYGELIIVDQVTLDPPSQLCVRVPAQGDVPLSSLTVRIEEPRPGTLTVCFEYLTQAPSHETADDAFYDEYRRAAYIDADLSTIQRIRQLAADGQLNSSVP